MTFNHIFSSSVRVQCQSLLLRSSLFPPLWYSSVMTINTESASQVTYSCKCPAQRESRGCQYRSKLHVSGALFSRKLSGRQKALIFPCTTLEVTLPHRLLFFFPREESDYIYPQAYFMLKKTFLIKNTVEVKFTKSL